MLKLALSFLVALCVITGAQAQSFIVPATQAVATFSGTTTINQIIAAKAGQSIYLTNITIHPANTSIVTLSYGTGTNCGTGTTAFYGPATFQAGENVDDGTGNGAIFVVPVGNAVCVTIATASAPGWIAYAQF